MNRRRVTAMPLDDVARALAKGDDEGVRYRSNPAGKRKPRDLFKSIRNTLHKQAGDGWKGKLLRKEGDDGTQWLFLLDESGTGKPSAKGFLREAIEPATDRALQVAREVGISLDRVITEGLKKLRDEIADKLKSNIESELQALDDLEK